MHSSPAAVRLKTSHVFLFVVLAREYGMKAYSERAEIYRLMHYVNAVGATELPLLSPGSFEARTTRIWKLP